MRNGIEELKIELGQHCFKDEIKIFKDESVYLKNKNYIFAKNGSGKSTFVDILKQQFSDSYDVRIFQGFDKILGENEKLGAFSLAVNAGENEKKIEEIENKKITKQNELNEMNHNLTELSNTDDINLFRKLSDSNKNLSDKQSEISEFYTASAAKIKNMSDPQISKTTYKKNDLVKELNSAQILQEVDVDKLKRILKSEEKIASILNIDKFDLKKMVDRVNTILTSKVPQTRIITRLDTDRKINFAEEALHLHELTEENTCIFCGNIIHESTFKELKDYFSADEVSRYKEKISEENQLIETQLNSCKTLNMGIDKFYPNFIEDAKNKGAEVKEQLDSSIKFLEAIKDLLSEKEKNLFSVSDKVNLKLPQMIDVSAFNQIVEENNNFGKNFDDEKEESKKKLRSHYIKLFLNEYKYYEKKIELDTLEKNNEYYNKLFNNEKNKKLEIEKNINILNKKIEVLKPVSEKQAVEHINRKLELSVSWKLDYYEEESSGYYKIIQNYDGNQRSRDIKDLSTGEKNIIAFLYFIEKLEEVNEDKKASKIIIFDDPMNSNDDRMQYLIITELQKLYQGKAGLKYNYEKDYLVVLTHNIHFYLNVQPQANYVIGTKIEINESGQNYIREYKKYDKSNFYHLQHGKFIKINSESEDFKTSYDALWIELHELVRLNLRNTMLNTMRRIIDTYIEFTKTPQQEFYKENEQYLKLFNVNSHFATDDYSSESFTETTEEMKELFEKIFKDNGDAAERHFNFHWKK